MNKGRTLIFNGLILSDSASASGEYQGQKNKYGPGYSRMFDTVDELLAEMKIISVANMEMGKGEIADILDARDESEINQALGLAEENKMLLIRTSLEAIGGIESYEKLTALVPNLPGLVMIGAWTNYPEEGESAKARLIW